MDYLCSKEDQHCGECPACARNAKLSVSAVVPGYNALISKQKEYIKFLEDAGKQMYSFLFAHGIQDSPEEIKKGERLRQEIAELEEAL